MRSDFERTGRLYPKLDAYSVIHLMDAPVDEDVKEIYLASSNQWATQKAFKEFMQQQPEFLGLNIKIRKAK